MLDKDPEANRIIEIEFHRWSNAIGLPEKLRTMKLACIGDGESFGILTRNPRVAAPIQLALMLIEADQVASPLGLETSPNYIDAICAVCVRPATI